jgi:hypothetical protein
MNADETGGRMIILNSGLNLSVFIRVYLWLIFF